MSELVRGAVETTADLEEHDYDAATPPPAGTAEPRRTEPAYRMLWSALHRAAPPRTLLKVVQYYSPTFRDCVFCYDLGARAERRIALTIDDAPSDEALMHQMLDILLAENVKATLFVIASFASTPGRLATLERAMREGHELGNHLVHDVSAFRSSAKQFEDDLLECDALIASLDPTWRLPNRRRWFRPPRGYLAAHMNVTLARHGYAAALADVFPLDTEVRSVDWLVQFVLTQAKPGSIVVLHAPDVRVTAGREHLRQNNVDVLAKLLPDLAAAGFLTGTLTNLADLFDAETAQQRAAAGGPSHEAPIL